MTLPLHTLASQAARGLAASARNAGAALLLLVFAVAALTATFTPAAEKAFSYAAPNIRQSFASASHFLAMVRGNYAVVYRPASSPATPHA